MASETIVAVFDSATDAEAAIAELHSAGIADSAIQHYSNADGAGGTYAARAGSTPADYAGGTGSVAGSYATGTTAVGGTAGTTSERPQGFWAWLMGEESTDEHAAVYDRSIESGGTVVTVVADSTDGERVAAILAKHSPVDLEERGSSYGRGGASATTAAGLGTTARAPDTTAAGGTARTGMGTDSTEEVIPLAEETLEVGKRQVDRGTTRLRRYVVERPVEEQIRLRNETVSVFRRPVSGAATVGADAFTDRTVELRETAEEAVVAKNARVVEEVVVKKGVEERVETVRDTVRREEVEVEGQKDRALGGATRPDQAQGANRPTNPVTGNPVTGNSVTGNPATANPGNPGLNPALDPTKRR